MALARTYHVKLQTHDVYWVIQETLHEYHSVDLAHEVRGVHEGHSSCCLLLYLEPNEAKPPKTTLMLIVGDKSASHWNWHGSPPKALWKVLLSQQNGANCQLPRLEVLFGPKRVALRVAFSNGHGSDLQSCTLHLPKLVCRCARARHSHDTEWPTFSGVFFPKVANDYVLAAPAYAVRPRTSKL